MERPLDVTSCEREPIRIPGAIQPHGVLLAVDPEQLVVRQAAGEPGSLGVAAGGLPLGRQLEEWSTPLAALVRQFQANRAPGGFQGSLSEAGRPVDVTVHGGKGRVLLIELEPGDPERAGAAACLAEVEEATGAFERAHDNEELLHQAAVLFRRITGFDRVMVYRFLEDNSGQVVAEDQAPGLHSFLDHRFPASDIPSQARDLYVRNTVRVIPDVTYRPLPLERAPGEPDDGPLDLSDCVLRSVSPIHLRYLENMGVAASASISIVAGDVLWGLIACHHMTPRRLPYEVRAMCRVLARVLSRQIGAQADAAIHRQRIRLRAMEDDLLGRLAREDGFEDGLERHATAFTQLISADGMAICRGGRVEIHGDCPEPHQVEAIRDWLLAAEMVQPFATETLPERFAAASEFVATGAGLLSIVLNRADGLAILWFRREQLQVVKWGGNPHQAMTVDAASGQLTPRASFELWQETVRGRARAWSRAEIETAGRLRIRLVELRQGKQLGILNGQLHGMIQDKEKLLAEQANLLTQKDLLLHEVNHRVQNSLQLVSSFLSLQMRGSQDPHVLAQLEEARRRLHAVALVHRRLYQTEQVQSVEMGRYLDELRQDLVSSFGPEWAEQLQVRSDTISVPTDQAVSLGLIVTELVVNSAKYAYQGKVGPIIVQLRELAGRAITLTVADRGVGEAVSSGTGFGLRMVQALCAQWQGSIDHQDNRPGRRVVITFRAAAA
ncbi:histidine kinase dimerization/phosphoacceptor domain -containing protein [Geminicoccus harenae]|uniref:histidine kinase dimerization/phosphoacceptor domain -containing protein n=1 Tax=Geminicoccus harenae TaxID=2498453 RepID=UPI00168C0414|nr:histidine kinase dimerization/phosphoacceptor domain -containing protein [Geminicoccus harenae]